MITKLNTEIFHDDSGKSTYLRVKKSKVTSHKNVAGGVFALLWVLAASSLNVLPLIFRHGAVPLAVSHSDYRVTSSILYALYAILYRRDINMITLHAAAPLWTLPRHKQRIYTLRNEKFHFLTRLIKTTLSKDAILFSQL